MEKRIGPRMLPCGTPASICLSGEKEDPICTRKYLSDKQFTDVFQLEVFILTLFKPFESTFISHISTYLDVIAYLYIFD
uniref:Uncharacterized protein n=1 Tax=Rhodnius prolixus TaxID=13249 RepID=T1HGB3_RHOPR